MKKNDLVGFRITRARRKAVGVLVAVDLPNRTVVIARDGKRYVRDMKRIWPMNPRQARRTP